MFSEETPSSAEQPLSVTTGQGDTVYYKKRYLYSRFTPTKNPLLIVQKTEIKPGTLVLCMSPLLGYGLAELLTKLTASSCILAIEYDEMLMAFSATHIAQSILSHPQLKYVRTNSPTRIIDILATLPGAPFRRCIRIDLSGGAALYPGFYQKVVSATDEAIAQFWKNRMTLIKLGRNYARNIFTNCSLLSKSYKLPEKNILKPIFVAGAGPSLDTALPFLYRNRRFLFLLAVDAALPTLTDIGILPDAIVLVESQFWIERIFCGFRNTGIPVFTDMTANPRAITATGGPMYFFLSEYTEARYFERLKAASFLPLIIPPLGSVGLVALYLAEQITTNQIPIFFSGLDFSWSTGFTHSRGAHPVRSIFSTTNRLFPPNSINASFAPGVFKTVGKNSEMYTDPTLSGYAEICRAIFGKLHSDSNYHLYDLGITGLETGCQKIDFKTAENLCRTSDINRNIVEEKNKTIRDKISSTNFTGESFPVDKQVIADFLETEIRNLTELKSIMAGTTLPENPDAAIAKYARQMDYLYIHFPDGYRGYQQEESFLKRMRIEIDYFLKTLTLALNDILIT